MPALDETIQCLAAIPDLQVQANVPLSAYTRFGIGGPADVVAEASTVEALVGAIQASRAAGRPCILIGSGTNLIVSDDGVRGVVVRYTALNIAADGCRVKADAGVELEALVNFTVERGLKGLETLIRIPGSAGAAIYGNAGAYGHSISERVHTVHFLDGLCVRAFEVSQCEFQYRASIFKRRKDWTILSVELLLEPADPAELRRVADEIRAIRDEKFPPSMKCAGSIFKNLILSELPSAVAGEVPASVVREGKVPAAYFLEQAGAKGMSRGGIHVADYHANLIYNTGGGTARELCELIGELKSRVLTRFGLELEEEVQYVGFD